MVWLAAAVVLHVPHATVVADAQFIPFNGSNWSVPFPKTLRCNTSNTNSSSMALPSLSWCSVDNPYIFSDFLSRNSTDLTTRNQVSGGADGDSFELNIFCDGEAVHNDSFVNYSSSSASSIYRSCKAIQAIQAGAAGTLNLNASVKNITQYIVFADLNGQLLFVFFNNNSMASNLKINMANINNFDVTNVQYVVEGGGGGGAQTDEGPPPSPYIVQDMVLFATNVTQAALVTVGGRDGKVSDPCVIFFYPQSQATQVDIKLVMASFFPKRANATEDLINVAFAAELNFSKTFNMNWTTATKPWWAESVYYYEVNTVPTTQAAAEAFVQACPGGTPMNIQLFIRVFTLVPCNFLAFHNRASNISFLLIHTLQGVTIHRIGYYGDNTTTAFNGTTQVLYRRTVSMVVDWCANKTVIDPATNTVHPMPRAKNTIFCVPNEETVIDKVDMISPDTFRGIGNYNKDVWVVIAMHNRTNAFVHVMSLTELIFVQDNASTFDNPLGLPASFGTPQDPCNIDTQVYYVDPHTGLVSCQERVTADYTLPDGANTTDLKTKVVTTRSGATTGNASSTSGESAGIGPAAQDHALIFVAQGPTVSVFAMYSDYVNSSAQFGLVFQPYNTISFLGNVSNVYISDNGMHLLTAVSRHGWELEAQTRYTKICDELARNPKDVFLQAFASQCNTMPPQDVNLNAFTQYASYCSFNLYCPSLDELAVTMPQDRYYADRPAVSKICPRGYFCSAGQKIECPQGFYCDVEGLMQPKRCANPVNSNSTCAQPGLVAPLPCPHGTVCSLPHIPGLPAPPGFQTPTPPVVRTDFVACDEGDWCTLGAQAPIPNTTFTNTTFQCPGNTYCASSDVITPVVCECTADAPGAPLTVMTANGSTMDCGDRTLFCPPGSQDVAFCPLGHYCVAPNVSVACIPTQYCGLGTFAPKLCPAGYYCPTPADRILCPSGHYCPDGTVLPASCNFLTVCPAGSSAQSRSLLTVFVLVTVVAAVLIGFCVFNRYEKAKEERAAAVAVMSKETREYLARGGLEDEDEDETSAASSASPRVKKSSSKGDPTTSLTAADTEENDLRQPIIASNKTTVGIPTSRFQTPLIQFKGMGLRLEVGEAKGKVVLDNVSGSIPPGSFVAVMGPSGSGKSTFMHTLAGKAFYGTRMGNVYINDDEVDLNRFSKIVGFVKQDDIMLREMTVFETLLFNARMRYDPLSMDRPEAIANAMLTALDLNHVRGINIGDEKKRGISGGQRKRVNIGMELVALPSVLFLDEPTSGLDSSSSMSVCSALHEMANVGITVIAVIHQPRYEIFNMFHKVLLLAKGGKLVYYGAPQDALAYFETYIGIKCPQHVNPPDFFMDVISGEVNDAGLSIDDMVVKWQTFTAEGGEGQATTPTTTDPEGRRTSPTTRTVRPPPGSAMCLATGGQGDQLIPGIALAAQANKKQIAGFFQQLRLFTVRSLVQLSRDKVWFFTDLMLVFVSGFFLGLVFSNSEYQPPLPAQIVNRSMSAFGASPPPMLSDFFARPVDDPIISIASLTCMAVGMTGVTAALRVFGNEQIVYWREASAGMSTSAYFLAKNLSHFLFIFISPMLYLAPFTTFVSTRASILSYYRVLVVLQFATTGLGYLISIVVPGGLAQLGGVVGVLVFAMFGGSRPTLVEIKEMFVLLQAMPYISYIRWAQEALYLEEISMWNDIEGVNIMPSLRLFDYDLSDYELCMWMTFVFGVGFRVLALIAMAIMHRDQKH